MLALSPRASNQLLFNVVFFEENAREKEGESEREKEKRLSDDDEEDAAEKEKTSVIINSIKVESGL